MVRDRQLIPKYLCDVRLFSVEIIVIDAQASQPGGAVERQGRDRGGEGGGGLQRVVRLGERRPWGGIFLDHHKERGKGGRRKERKGGRQSAASQEETQSQAKCRAERTHGNDSEKSASGLKS